MGKANKIVKNMKNKVYDKSTEEDKNEDDEFDIYSSEFIRKGIKTGIIACLTGVLIGGAINVGTGIGINLQEHTDDFVEKVLDIKDSNSVEEVNHNQENTMEMKNLNNNEYGIHTLYDDVLFYLGKENIIQE